MRRRAATWALHRSVHRTKHVLERAARVRAVILLDEVALHARQSPHLPPEMQKLGDARRLTHRPSKFLEGMGTFPTIT